MLKELCFRRPFDPKGRKGKGVYELSTLKKEDLVKVAKILTMDNNDDVLVRFIKNKLEFEFGDLKQQMHK